MFLEEVDVQPRTACGTSVRGRDGDQSLADAAAATVRADHGIEEKGVVCAVPSDVDEPDQAASVVRDGPAEAVRLDESKPVSVEQRVTEGVCV